MKTVIFVALLIASTFVPALAADVALHADPTESTATFSVKHFTLTTVSGTIGIKEATLVAGDDHTIKKADATLDLNAIDTHASDRDDDLRSDHWFDVATYPVMTFKSTKVETAPDGTMTVTGDLTFHGVTKPVTLAAKYEGSVKDGRGRTHVGYNATGTLDRTAWNLGSNFPAALIGNDVTITLEFEAIEG
jgi:polyisoprenoid-binding protein YceI